MTARNVVVRLLAALADDTPAFRIDASYLGRGRGRRLLAGLADATPAFTPASRPDEYAPSPRTPAPEPGRPLDQAGQPEDSGVPRDVAVADGRDAASTSPPYSTAQLLRTIENTLVVSGFADDRSGRALLLDLIHDNLGYPLPLPVSDYVTGREQMIAIVEACSRTPDAMNALVQAVRMMRPDSPEAIELRTLVGAYRHQLDEYASEIARLPTPREFGEGA